MRLKHLKFLKILNRAGKRVVSLLGAVALICLNSSFIISASAEVTPTELDVVKSMYSLESLPEKSMTSGFSTWYNNRSDSELNEIIIYRNYSDRVIEVIYYIYDTSEFNVTFDDDKLKFVNISNSSANVGSYDAGIININGSYGISFGHTSVNLSGNINAGGSFSSNSIPDYIEIISNHDIKDSSGNVVVDKFVKPESWLYDVSYSPVLTDELSDLQYIDVTVSLQEAFIKYLEVSDYMYRLDFLPYISGTSASDNLAQSYDYAYAVAPYRGTYYDKYTVQAGSWGNNHVTGTYNKDNCLGTSIVYTLNSANNYSASVRISIPDTSLVSGNQYYFNIVGIMSSELWYKTADSSSPNRALFRQLYDDYSSGNLSDWSDDGLQSFRVMDSTAFTMSSVLKKTSKNYNVDGGLMSNTSNALNSNPSIIKDVAGSGNDLAFSEVEDYNNQQAEDYVESAPDKDLSGFSLSGLLSTLNYSDEFLGFLSYGFSILPIQIWSLIKFSIVAVCFVGIVKTAVHQ